MLHFDLWATTRDFVDLDASMRRLWEYADVRDELEQLLEILGTRSERLDFDPELGPTNPLRVHQRYTRWEALAAMGVGSPAQPPNIREGVYFVQGVADLLFVTLHKDPARFKPTTRYHDYALCRGCFTGNRSPPRRTCPPQASATSITCRWVPRCSFLSARAPKA